MARPIVDTRLEEWRQVHAVNLDGVFLGTRTALRSMQASGGVIINIASLAGLEVYPGAAAYASSKAAVIHLSKVAAQEAASAPSGIRVHVIAPGGVKTPMWHSLPNWPALAAAGEAAAWQALDPAGEFLTPEEMAEVVLTVILDPATPAPGEVVIPHRAADGSVQSRA
jgi:NAD(P)-dependent dehydrogenase (short-subunit alcohol dehydrogenase family)